MSQTRPAVGPPAREAGDPGIPERRTERRAGKSPAGWATRVRGHWLAAALLTAGLVLRVLAGLAYRPALFYIDTTRYLYNAEGMDPVGYKGPLRAILAAGGFGAVATVQHLLGLAMAVVLYVLLLRRGAPRWLAALATGPVLLDAYQIQAEQSVMPTVWFEALIVAGLAILLWRPAPGWRAIAAGGIVLGTSATFAQVGEALLIPAVIYLMAVGGGWRRVLGRAAALAGAFALPILVYCTISYALSGAFYLSHTGVTSFYGRAAAAVDCATIRLPAAERGMCPSAAQQALGPDWLEYGGTSPIRPYYAHLPRARTDSLISDFSHRVLTQQPGRLLAAYGDDVIKLFALTRDGRPGDTPIARWQFQTSFPYFTPHSTPQVVRAEISQYGGGTPAVWRPAAAFLRGYQLHGGYTPGPLMVLVTLAGAAGSATLLRRRALRAAGAPARQQALACLLLFGSGVFLLLVSDTFEFSWRYQLPALVTLVPAGALGVTAVLRTAQARRRPAGAPPS